MKASETARIIVNKATASKETIRPLAD